MPDLVPQEALTAWVTQLRIQHATFLFRSASSFLPRTQLNDPKAKGKAKESADDAAGAETLLEYLGQYAGRIESETLQVAVVGLTNVCPYQ
jgi:nuclear GTP-binding protein